MARPAFSSAYPVREGGDPAVDRPAGLVPERQRVGRFGPPLQLGLEPAAAPRGQRRLAVVDDPQHCPVRLGPHDQRRRLVGDRYVQIRERRPPRGLGPGAERHHGHAGDVQRRQHARHVRGQRALIDDDQHLVGAEPARIGERQVGDPVQADRGLAAAGGPLDGDQPGRRLRDQLELARIDQRRDGRQVAVGAAGAAVVEPQLAARRRR
ncbi:MAG: hypothetical protein ABUS79_22960 [Pseudomonadota bacterium]